MNKATCKTILIFFIFLGSVGASGEVSKRVLFLGDSLAAGFGLSEEQAYPALLEIKARKAGYQVDFVNAGVSGDTTAGGLRRLNWLLRQRVDVLVVALGGNDALRGIDPRETEKNLAAIIDAYRTRVPKGKVILAGMRAPENMGPEYTKAFAAIYPRLAAEKKTALMPFLLEGVAAKPELNQADGIHPNAGGQREIADNFWPVLKKVLN